MMRHLKQPIGILVVVLGTIFIPLSGAAADFDLANENSIKELSERIDSILSKYNLPGAGIAFVTADSILWVGGIGLANLETGETFTENTPFQVASISKTLVALSVQKLVEQGRLDLNQPVKEICPDIELDNPWTATDPVRIVHLLEHTSGIDNLHFNEAYNLDKNPNLPLKDVLAINPQSRRVRYRPGTRMSYSNDGYALVGYAIQQITGEKFEDFMKEEVLDPLGMNNSTFWYESKTSASLAQGYLADNEPLSFTPLYMKPASSLISTPHDLAVLVKLMLNRGMSDGQPFVSEESVDRMEIPTTSHVAREGLRLGYGLGIRPRFARGYKYLGHGGGIPGFQCQFSYFKELGFGCVVMVNSSEEGFGSVFREVVKFLIPETRELPSAGTKLSPEVLEKYDGYYQYNSSETYLDAQLNTLLAGVTITHQDSSLYVSELGSDTKRLIAVSENTFRRANEPEATLIFFTDDQGAIVMADPVYNAEYYRTGSWKPLVYRGSLLLAVALIISCLIYALIWIPVYLYKRVRRIDSRIEYVSIRVMPLLSIVALMISLVALMVCFDDVVRIGYMSLPAVVFFIFGILFAVLSVASLATALWILRLPARTFARFYALMVSSACVGLSIYLWYWDVIGLRLWAY